MLARVHVGQSLHKDVRVTFSDTLRHGIDEPHHRSGRRTFLGIYGVAFLAMAISVVVVLAYANDPDARLGRYRGKDVGNHDSHQVGIGQAQLSSMAEPLTASIDLAEIFGMGVKVASARNKRLERVGDSQFRMVPERLAAVFRFKRRLVAVDPEPRREIRNERILPKRFAQCKCRRVTEVKTIGNIQPFQFRHHLVPT